MSSKPTILVSEKNFETLFQIHFMEKMWEQYFNVEILDINKHYDKRNTVVVSDWLDFSWKQDTEERILANKGIRHVIDHSPDSWDSSLDNSADFTIRPIDWYRIHESIWYKYLGYDKLELKSNHTRDFLMLINHEVLDRTKLYDRLTPILANNIYSYIGHGVPLQNAQDRPCSDENWQRYIDPSWYTNTRFSIVCESFDKTMKKQITTDNINVTEKTLKPCAFKHPSIVWGPAGTLAWQKRQGFETFDHCIDESYDTVLDRNIRLDKIVEQINLCVEDKTIFTDALTLQKLEHNYNHFYNEEIVMKLLHEQVINPLLEFINA